MTVTCLALAGIAAWRAKEMHVFTSSQTGESKIIVKLWGYPIKETKEDSEVSRWAKACGRSGPEKWLPSHIWRRSGLEIHAKNEWQMVLGRIYSARHEFGEAKAAEFLEAYQAVGNHDMESLKDYREWFRKTKEDLRAAKRTHGV